MKTSIRNKHEHCPMEGWAAFPSMSGLPLILGLRVISCAPLPSRVAWPRSIRTQRMGDKHSCSTPDRASGCSPPLYARLLLSPPSVTFHHTSPTSAAGIPREHTPELTSSSASHHHHDHRRCRRRRHHGRPPHRRHCRSPGPASHHPLHWRDELLRWRVGGCGARPPVRQEQWHRARRRILCLPRQIRHVCAPDGSEIDGAPRKTAESASTKAEVECCDPEPDARDGG